MFHARCPLILASASPRRQAFLHQLGLAYQAIPANIEEIALPRESPQDFVVRMALAKATQVAELHPQACVVGADTVVSLEERIFGKPADRREAMTMLTALQGRTHLVTTGLAVVAKTAGCATTHCTTTKVRFGSFAPALLQAYVDTGEPLDKAGAYGIQGLGGFLVDAIQGSYDNVVGLPMHALVNILLSQECIEVDTPTQTPTLLDG